MLIRVNGRHDGVKRYLEDGQKKDREQSRDQLDERITFAGDLELTDAVIQSINVASDVDRYLHITMSFKEDYVAPETIYAAVEDFRKFVFAAYRSDELNFYAEAHLPRLKSYINRKDGTVVERKPHVHIVIPKANLLTGMRADPIGYVPITMQFIDAVQEQINARYGFASPKDHRRTQLTGSSEMISRYRGDIFGQNSQTLKAELLDAVLDRRIETYSDFLTLLAERGAVRMRNAGRTNEYPNVKLPGEAKGINLKESVFLREFVSLTTEAKLQKLGADVKPVYLQTNPPRSPVSEIDRVVDDWMNARARETKYLNSGNKTAYSAYQALSPAARIEWLDGREGRFYHQHLGSDNERGSSSDGRPSGRPDGGVRRGGRKYDFKRVGVSQTHQPKVDERGSQKRVDGLAATEPAISQPGQHGRPRVADAKRWERGARGHSSGSSAESLNGLRSLSSVPVVRFTGRSEVLLPHHASRVLEHPRPQRTDPLRWDRDSERKLTAATTRWDKTYPERGREASRTSDRPLSLGGWRHHRRWQHSSVDRPIHSVVESDEPHDIANAERFGGRKTRPTGRISDSAISQRRRDEFEARQSRFVLGATRLDKLAGELTAPQLLVTLSHSHGLLAEKYAAVRGHDGIERIWAGDKELDVRAFLTKELHLPWREAVTVLRDASRNQSDGRVDKAVVQRPDAVLWREFNVIRNAALAAKQEHWHAQRIDERRRWAEIKVIFEARRAVINTDPGLSRQARRSGVSIARVERVERERSLQARIGVERAVLAETHFGKEKTTFAEYLQKEAQAGNIDALRELRRSRKKPILSNTAETAGRLDNEIRPYLSVEANEIIYKRPMLSHYVLENGDVTYRRDGLDVVHDRGASVMVTKHDPMAIEIGLRLAMAKYGDVLQLTGSDDFKREAVSVSVKAGLRVKFNDEALNVALTVLHTAGVIHRSPVGTKHAERDYLASTVKGIEGTPLHSKGSNRE